MVPGNAGRTESLPEEALIVTHRSDRNSRELDNPTTRLRPPDAPLQPSVHERLRDDAVDLLHVRRGRGLDFRFTCNVVQRLRSEPPHLIIEVENVGVQ